MALCNSTIARKLEEYFQIYKNTKARTTYGVYTLKFLDFGSDFLQIIFCCQGTHGIEFIFLRLNKYNIFQLSRFIISLWSKI